MRINRIAAIVLLVAADPARIAAQASTAGADGASEWSYAGPTGPKFWPDLNTICGGRRQSPVDLPTIGSAAPLRVQVRYGTWSDGYFLNDGHSVAIPADMQGTLTVADSVFRLREIHVHVPAEHTVHGHRYAAEIHAVHQHASGARAVLGTFVAEGAANPLWDALIRAMPGKGGDRNPVDGQIDPTRLLAVQDLAAERIYGYAGSLTIPPCDENVRWMVRAAPIVMSHEQVEAFASAMVHNARPVQPVNGRTVQLHRGGP